MQSSVNKAEEPSVVMFDANVGDVDFEKIKRQKQGLKEKAAILLAKEVAAKRKRDELLPPAPKIAEVSGGCGYDPFAQADKDQKEALIALLKTCPEFKKPKPKQGSTTFWYRNLRLPHKWLWDTHIEAGIDLLRQRFSFHPQWFRSGRICFVDSFFTKTWLSKYGVFRDSADDYGLGRLLPPGAYDLYTGTQPDFCCTNMVWGIHVDDIYTALNIDDTHWLALMISIPKKRIYVWDSIHGCCAGRLDAHLAPLCEMVPYVMHILSPPDQKRLHTLDPYQYEVVPEAETPQCLSGDCGVFTLKYIECHALGVPFSHHNLSSANIKSIREKLAVDIHHELQRNGTEKRVYKDLDVYDRKL